MFAAKPLCFLLQLFGKCGNHSFNTDNSVPKAEFKHKLLLVLSGASEVALMILSYLSLTMAAAGVYQMLNGTIIFWSFLLSLFYLKRKFIWLHYVAMLLIIAGILLVGANSLLFEATVRLIFSFSSLSKIGVHESYHNSNNSSRSNPRNAKSAIRRFPADY